MSAATLSSNLLASKGGAAPAGGRSRTPKRAVAAGLRPVGAGTSTASPTASPKAPGDLPAGPQGEVVHDDGGAPPGAERARVTLRLDGERHRRLRVAAACRGESMQTVMVAALDAYLASGAGGCVCVADAEESVEQVPEALRGLADV
jgi:hypothetical protein